MLYVIIVYHIAGGVAMELKLAVGYSTAKVGLKNCCQILIHQLLKKSIGVCTSKYNYRQI